MAQRVCDQCGNTVFRFDKNKHAVVCTVCDCETNASDRVEEMLRYDQQRSKAIAFVRAHDYISAKPFLENMRMMQPDDPDIYYLHLMGLTCCCSDLLLNDSDSIEIASKYWRILTDLNGERQIFIRYMTRRKSVMLERCNRVLFRNLIILVVSILVMLLSLAFVGQGLYVFLLGVVGSIALLYVSRAMPRLIANYKKVTRIEKANTPFFE